MVNRFAVISGGVVVNIASANSAFAEEQGWVVIPDGLPVAAGWMFDEGGFHEPPPQPVAVPERVEMAQARLALFQAGLLPQVDTAIDAISDPTQRETARIEWEYRSTVRRDSELVAGLGASLGLTNEQIDDLFRLADTL